MSESLHDIVVPASTSNLGSAFDALAVAVNLYLRVRIVEMRPAEPDTLEISFSGEQPPGENRIETAFRRAAAAFGGVLTGIRAHVTSDVPMAAGLGSSAAATIAGLRLYETASGSRLSTEDSLGIATELDGHPDNAAASLLGGIVLSCLTDDGRIMARAWRWPDEIALVVATPEFPLHTKHARAVLPKSVPLGDAVANLQRALLLVRALETARYDDLHEALKDRWHQPARVALVPGLANALSIDHPAVLGVCLSGAGPSILALAAPGGAAEAASVLGGVYRRLNLPHTIRTLAAHQPATSRLPLAAAGQAPSRQGAGMGPREREE